MAETTAAILKLGWRSLWIGVKIASAKFVGERRLLLQHFHHVLRVLFPVGSEVQMTTCLKSAG